MKKRTFRQGLALAMALFMTINYGGSYLGRSPVVSLADTTATVNATSLNVRTGPGTTYGTVGKLSYGSSVRIVGETRGSDQKIWYQIRFTKNGTESAGYVRSDYIKFPTSYQSDGDFERYLTNQGFPESYKQGLRQLHAEYPNWVFTAQHTNLDWKEAIDNESVVGRNLVPGSSISSWKSMEAGAYNWETGTWPSFDSGSWVAASREIISYYMDPRNFLNEKYVFQFLKHKYNSSIHTIDGVKNMVQGTFLDNSVDVSKSQSSEDTNVGPGVSSGSPGGSVNPGGGAGGSDEAGPGVSGGSSPGTGSQGGVTVQPGVRPGQGGTDTGASRPGGISGGTTTVQPGGSKGDTTVQPGAGPGTGTSQPSGGAASQPGGSGGNALVQPGVRPGASISKREGSRVGTSIGPGGLTDPGEVSGPGVTGGPGTSSGGSTYSAPIASYAEIIMNAASKSGVNPYVLTAMILQEQGSQGSRGVSGKVPGYEGYYNFFNIEAYQSGSLSAIERGLWYASQSGSYERPWNSVDKAILGGAVYYGTNYVNAGQDTFYLKKFNVQGSNLYKHQYMTNVEAAAAEGAKLQEAYNSQLKQLALEFKIPVYKNMPDQPCEKPTSAGNPNNKLSSLSVDGFVLTPTFNKDVTSYTIIAGPEVTTVNVRAAALDSKAVITGIGNIGLQSGNTDITVQVKAQNGTICQYVIHVVRQDNGPASGPGVGGSQSPGAVGGPGSLPPGQTQSPEGNISIEIITGGPGQSSSGGSSGHTGPGGSNVTIVQ